MLLLMKNSSGNENDAVYDDERSNHPAHNAGQKAS